MDDLLLSKSDLKKIAWFALFLIIVSFCGGFFSAKFSNKNIENKLNQFESKLAAIQKEHSPAQTENQPINQSVTSEKPVKEIVPLETQTKTELYENNILLTANKPYGIQAGLFNSYKNAKSLHLNLLKLGINNQIILHESDLSIAYRIVVKQFDNKNKALEALTQLRDSYNMRLSLVSLYAWEASKKVAMN